MLEFLIGLECNTRIVNDTRDTGVNLRERPNGALIQKLPNGITVSPLVGYQNWLLVNVRGQSGWMYKPLTRSDTNTYLLRPDSHFVLLRESDSPNAPIITQLLNGTPVTVWGTVGDWSKIQVPHWGIGYVPSRYVKQPSC